MQGYCTYCMSDRATVNAMRCIAVLDSPPGPDKRLDKISPRRDGVLAVVVAHPNLHNCGTVCSKSCATAGKDAGGLARSGHCCDRRR